MTKKRSAKNAFISSLVMLCLCVTMLVGTTFAWYTDSVTSGRNTIVAGSLDMTLQYYTGTGGFADDDSWTKVTPTTPVFSDSTTFEPGATQVAYVRVKNSGDLAFKYKLSIAIDNETAGQNKAGATLKLSDYLYYGTEEFAAQGRAPYANRDAAISAVAGNTAKIKDALLKEYQIVEAGKTSDIIAIVIYMPAETGNDANPDPAHKPSITFGLNAIAAQFVSEEDGFGNDYDENAVYPATASKVIPASGSASTLEAGGVTVALPANTGTTAASYTLDVSDTNTTTNATTGATDVSFDATLYKNNVKVSSGTEVYELTMDIGPGATINSVTHNGTALAEGTGDQHYQYNATSGILTIYTSSFSPFAVNYLPPLMTATNGTTSVGLASLEAFAASVNGGNSYEGYTVELNRNVDLTGVEWTPIGDSIAHAFKGTFDGKGYTISNLSATRTTAGIGLFGYVGGESVNTAVDNIDDIWTAENYTVDISPVVESAYGTVIKNINIENFTLAGTGGSGKYIGSVVGFAQNTYVSGITVKNSTLSSAADGKVGGVVGASAGNMAFVDINVVSGSFSADSDNNAGGIAGTVQRSINDGSTNPQHLVVFYHCTNAAAVSADNHAGGIVGNAGSNNSLHCAVVECTNSGSVTGKTGAVAGIVGEAHSKFLLLECTNSGNVSLTAPVAPARIGGIATRMYCGGWIRGCTNTGTLTGEGAEIGNIFSGIAVGNSVRMTAIGYEDSSADFLTGTDGSRLIDFMPSTAPSTGQNMTEEEEEEP